MNPDTLFQDLQIEKESLTEMIPSVGIVKSKLREILLPALSLRGFSARRDTFQKVLSSGIRHELSLHCQARPDYSVACTVGVGVFLPRIHGLIFADCEVSTTVGANIGRFSSGTSFRWWQFFDESEVEIGVSQIQGIVLERVIPWLALAENERQVFDFIVAGEEMSKIQMSADFRAALILAGTFTFHGKVDALRLLSQYEKDMPSFGPHVRDVEARIRNC